MPKLTRRDVYLNPGGPQQILTGSSSPPLRPPPIKLDVNLPLVRLFCFGQLWILSFIWVDYYSAINAHRVYTIDNRWWSDEQEYSLTEIDQGKTKRVLFCLSTQKMCQVDIFVLLSQSVRNTTWRTLANVNVFRLTLINQFLVCSSSAQFRNYTSGLSTRGFQDRIPPRHRPTNAQRNNSWKSLGLINRESHSHIDLLHVSWSSVHYNDAFKRVELDVKIPSVHWCRSLRSHRTRRSSPRTDCTSYSMRNLQQNNSSNRPAPCMPSLTCWLWPEQLSGLKNWAFNNQSYFINRPAGAGSE